jgi:two-component system OmpR family sensor kinase
VSLRSRLVAGFLLVAIVLLGADVGIGVFVHRSLIQAVDQRLSVARGGPARAVEPPANAADRTTRDRSAAFTDLYVTYIPTDGTAPIRSAPPAGSHQPEVPAVPSNITKIAAPAGTVPHPFTVHDVGGGGDGFRAVAFHTPTGGILFIAAPLRDTATTFRNVLVVEGGATSAVLLALGLVAFFVLHLGVRPLDQMAETADAIAAGDLSRRIERADTQTEAGRLGLALNTMLGEIQQAMEQRAASEERLRRFVADASHELRTPLTSIRGYAELWRQGGLSETADLADAMRRMEKESARMGVLVDEMLLLARLDQGRPLETEPVDLAHLVADVVADARAVEPDRPISLEGPDHLFVVGDEGRLHQVVSNLLANPRVHTPRGTPVRARVGADATMAFLEVEDDGPGFGADPGRVFERFYRADPARARASGGTGLGLSIVAAVSEAHGGRATAGSSPSGGARIRVEIPLSNQPARTPPPEDQLLPVATQFA